MFRKNQRRPLERAAMCRPGAKNCISSSRHQSPSQFIFPLTRPDSWAQLVSSLALVPKQSVQVYINEPNRYLAAEFKMPRGFIDDVEFWVDPRFPKYLQVRSASRVGIYDFGVNRGRIEFIRTVLDQL